MMFDRTMKVQRAVRRCVPDARDEEALGQSSCDAER